MHQRWAAKYFNSTYLHEQRALPEPFLNVISIANEVEITEVWPWMSRHGIVDVAFPNMVTNTGHCMFFSAERKRWVIVKLTLYRPSQIHLDRVDGLCDHSQNPSRPLFSIWEEVRMDHINRWPMWRRQIWGCWRHHLAQHLTRCAAIKWFSLEDFIQT